MIGSTVDLVDRARAGDTRAYEKLLEPLIAPAARFAFGMVQDREEAEDVVQEAALKAWRYLGNLREGAPFGPWFFGIVANECRTVFRRPWHQVLPVGELMSGDAVSAEAEFLRGDELRRALKRLPPDQRAAILLHFFWTCRWTRSRPRFGSRWPGSSRALIGVCGGSGWCCPRRLDGDQRRAERSSAG